MVLVSLSSPRCVLVCALAFAKGAGVGQISDSITLNSESITYTDFVPADFYFTSGLLGFLGDVSEIRERHKIRRGCRL